MALRHLVVVVVGPVKGRLRLVLARLGPERVDRRQPAKAVGFPRLVAAFFVVASVVDGLVPSAKVGHGRPRQEVFRRVVGGHLVAARFVAAPVRGRPVCHKREYAGRRRVGLVGLSRVVEVVPCVVARLRPVRVTVCVAWPVRLCVRRVVATLGVAGRA